MADAGLPLTAGVEKVCFGGEEAFFVDEGELAVCLATRYDPAWMEGMLAREPRRIFTLDQAFEDQDALLFDLAQRIEALGIQWVRR